jgi:hypothetical protein
MSYHDIESKQVFVVDCITCGYGQRADTVFEAETLARDHINHGTIETEEDACCDHTLQIKSLHLVGRQL